MFDDEKGLAIAEPVEMAKKKAEKASKERARQGIILVYKADEQTMGPFKEWLEGLAEHVAAPITVTLDMALKEFAAKRGFSKPMPKRLAK